MTVSSTPTTGKRASMSVPSYPCMMITSTMTQVIWSISRTQPLPHACRRHHQQHMHGQQLPRHCPAADQPPRGPPRLDQVRSKVQNTCKIQVMLDNLAKYMLLHFCSGNPITLANEKLLRKAPYETQPYQIQAMLLALSTITVITLCWAFIKLDNIKPLSMYLYKPQPHTPTTTAATPTAACWPPSPPTRWSGTPSPWSQASWDTSHSEKQKKIQTRESACRVFLEWHCSLYRRRSPNYNMQMCAVNPISHRVDTMQI